MTTKLLAQNKHNVLSYSRSEGSLAKPRCLQGCIPPPTQGLSEYMQGNKFQILGVGTWTSLGAMILPTTIWVSKRSWGATWPQGLAESVETDEFWSPLRQEGRCGGASQVKRGVVGRWICHGTETGYLVADAPSLLLGFSPRLCSASFHVRWPREPSPGSSLCLSLHLWSGGRASPGAKVQESPRPAGHVDSHPQLGCGLQPVQGWPQNICERLTSAQSPLPRKRVLLLREITGRWGGASLR